MKKLLGLALPAALLALSAQPASAVTKDHFGDQAASVAREGNCKNVRKRSSEGAYTLSGVVCDLRGERVNVITFSAKKDEIRWLTTTCALLPDQWVLIGYGFIVTAKDGNETAVRVGRRVYGGKPQDCSA